MNAVYFLSFKTNIGLLLSEVIFQMTHSVCKCHINKCMPWVLVAVQVEVHLTRNSRMVSAIIVTNLLPKIVLALCWEFKEIEHNMHALFAKWTAINYKTTMLNNVINQKIMDSSIYYKHKMSKYACLQTNPDLVKLKITSIYVKCGTQQRKENSCTHMNCRFCVNVGGILIPTTLSLFSEPGAIYFQHGLKCKCYL